MNFTRSGFNGVYEDGMSVWLKCPPRPPVLFCRAGERERMTILDMIETKMQMEKEELSHERNNRSASVRG